MAERDTWGYEIWRDGKLVYVGITNDPERRTTEHEANGLGGTMRIKTNARSRETAEQWEHERIETYQQNHGGKMPPRNKQG